MATEANIHYGDAKEEIQTISISTSSEITSGSVGCIRRGNIAQIFFYGVTFRSSGTYADVVTGIPKAKMQSNIYFSNGNNGWISNNGTSVSVNINSSPSSAHWGGVTYICAD